VIKEICINIYIFELEEPEHISHLTFIPDKDDNLAKGNGSHFEVVEVYNILHLFFL
jgi:hypothetical protein